MVHVHYSQGTLDASTKQALAEKLTHVLIEIEGGPGKDGPKARSISWVMFYEVPADSWTIGGKLDGTYISPPGKFLVNVHVPEGALSNARKAMVQKMVYQSLFEAFGLEVPDDPETVYPSIFVMVTEWLEGNMGARGRVYGLADIGAYVGGNNETEIRQRSKKYLQVRAAQRASAGYPD
jgi:phenylpyruvate tautomerase PptA (4-oxalocrotonate tautomerase family)